MSKALKCNCCEKCFDPYNVKGDIVTLHDVCFQTSEEYTDWKYHESINDIHFCPECAPIFLEMLKGTKLVDKRLLDTLQEDYDAMLKEKDEKENEEKDIAVQTAQRIINLVRRAACERCCDDSIWRLSSFIRNCKASERKGEP